MKQAILAVAVTGALVLTARPAVMHAVPQAGMAADRTAVEQTVMANDKKINDAFAKRDVATMKMYIADDGSAMGMSGLSSVPDFYKQMPTMDMKITEQSSTDFKFVWVNATTVVDTYTWAGKGTMMGQPIPAATYCSTVWTKRGTKWVAVFHQETAAAPAPGK